MIAASNVSQPGTFGAGFNSPAGRLILAHLMQLGMIPPSALGQGGTTPPATQPATAATAPTISPLALPSAITAAIQRLGTNLTPSAATAPTTGTGPAATSGLASVAPPLAAAGAPSTGAPASPISTALPPSMQAGLEARSGTPPGANPSIGSTGGFTGIPEFLIAAARAINPAFADALAQLNRQASATSATAQSAAGPLHQVPADALAGNITTQGGRSVGGMNVADVIGAQQKDTGAGPSGPNLDLNVELDPEQTQREMNQGKDTGP